MTISVRFLVLQICILFSLTLSGQNIFPGAVGFGTDSRGAYAGSNLPEILIVDNLRAENIQTGNNRGSFEWALSQDYPRLIVFEVGGVIDYSPTETRSIYLKHPYCNIYGQTAPSPGITLKSSSIVVSDDAHDILFQHIAIRYGAYRNPDNTVSPQDCLTLLKGSYNIVVDHCSFSWSVDEIIGAYTKNLTISNSLMYEGLEYNYHANEGGDHEPERHGYGPIAASPENFTSYNNLYAWFTNRFPKMSSNNIAYINNYATGHGTFGPDVASLSSGNNAAFVGNCWYPTPGMSDVDNAHFFMRWRGTLNLNSTFFMKDNNCLRRDNGISQSQNVLTNMSETDFNKVYTDNPSENVIDITDYEIKKADNVLTYIIKHAGFRPWDRDYYDSIAIEKLIEGKQDFISSPDALPARAYNRSIYEGLRTSAGNMANGYDFSKNNVSFTVNGKTIRLTENTSSQIDVLDLLNAQLPSGIEAVDHPHSLCKHIIIKTIATGSDQQIEINGDASVFGIAKGTYKGEDAPYVHVNYPSTSHSLNIPTNPHEDDNNNGFTDFQEWVNKVPDLSEESSITPSENSNDSTIKININAKENLSGWNELTDQNYALENLSYVSGKSSPYKFEMWTDWRASNGGETTGNCYPESVIKTYVFTDDNNIRQFRFSELNNSRAYDIEFLCSRSSAAPEDRGAVFIAGNVTDSINAKGNKCETVKFENLRPIKGTISIDYRKRINDYNGHVNAILITEKEDNGMNDSDNVENNRPVIILNFNETGVSAAGKSANNSFGRNREQ